MAASRHTVENILNALMREGSFVAPSELWISLHTADPGETGGNEVDTTDWPSYERRDSLQGDTKDNAWSVPDVDGITFNQKQLIFPVYNGTGSVTITHFGIWGAATGGTFIASGELTTPREIGPSQVFVADFDKLGVKME
jgi:hypothetical protein